MRIVGQEQIADMLGVAPKTVVEWQEQGLPITQRGRPGVASEYDSAAVIEWLVQREVSKLGVEGPRNRLARLQADEIELRLAEKAGLVVPAAKVEPMWLAMVGAAKAYLRAEVNRLAQLLDHTAGVEAKRDLLGETFDQFLNKLSGYDPDDNDGDGGGAGVAPAYAPLLGPPGAAAPDLGRTLG